MRCVYYGHIESDIIVYQISRKPNIKQPIKDQPRPEKIQQKNLGYDRSKGKRKITTYVCGAEHPATLCAELDRDAGEMDVCRCDIVGCIGV